MPLPPAWKDRPKISDEDIVRYRALAESWVPSILDIAKTEGNGNQLDLFLLLRASIQKFGREERSFHLRWSEWGPESPSDQGCHSSAIWSWDGEAMLYYKRWRFFQSPFFSYRPNGKLPDSFRNKTHSVFFWGSSRFLSARLQVSWSADVCD